MNCFAIRRGWIPREVPGTGGSCHSSPLAVVSAPSLCKGWMERGFRKEGKIYNFFSDGDKKRNINGYT